MSDDRFERAFVELELARRRRELLFWTLRGWLATVALAGLTVALLVGLVEGEVDHLQVALGSGALGAGGLMLRRMEG
jgi:hypothetical protein